MKYSKNDNRRYTKSYKSSVKIYHLQSLLDTESEHGLDDYAYLGSLVVYALSMDNVLKETWKLTQNDGRAWSLNPYFTAAEDAVSFRSSKIGDIFEVEDVGFFRVTKNGFVQVKFQDKKGA